VKFAFRRGRGAGAAEMETNSLRREFGAEAVFERARLIIQQINMSLQTGMKNR